LFSINYHSNLLKNLPNPLSRSLTIHHKNPSKLSSSHSSNSQIPNQFPLKSNHKQQQQNRVDRAFLKLKLRLTSFFAPENGQQLNWNASILGLVFSLF
jgi:hypothetical protein